VGFGDIPCWVEPTDRVVGWGVAGRVVLDRLDQHFLAGGDDRGRPELVGGQGGVGPHRGVRGDAGDGLQAGRDPVFVPDLAGTG
jgi:hypothetical protein